MIDLHTHTVFSDGTTTPEENVRLAVAAGLSGLAITDHDTIAGWQRAGAACDAAGIAFVPGLEFSCEAGGHGVHILGYWVDPTNEPLRAECARLRSERERRGREILARLRDLGVELDEADVRRRAAGAPVGRPHIAAVLVDRGIVPDLETAFDRYLADDGPAYVAKRALDPVRGIGLLRAAGGAAVIAHPAMSQPAVTLDLVDEMTAAGLAGIEADHPAHDPEQTRRWRAVAAARGLVVTGSSDFHGERKDAKVGQRATPVSVVDELRAHCVQVPV